MLFTKKFSRRDEQGNDVFVIHAVEPVKIKPHRSILDILFYPIVLVYERLFK